MAQRRGHFGTRNWGTGTQGFDKGSRTAQGTAIGGTQKSPVAVAQRKVCGQYGPAEDHPGHWADNLHLFFGRVLGLNEVKYSTESTWFKGDCSIISYQLEELLGTKLRALYQRRKGRDLFDLYWAMSNQKVDVAKLLQCYYEYMNFV